MTELTSLQNVKYNAYQALKGIPAPLSGYVYCKFVLQDNFSLTNTWQLITIVISDMHIVDSYVKATQVQGTDKYFVGFVISYCVNSIASLLIDNADISTAADMGAIFAGAQFLSDSAEIMPELPKTMLKFSVPMLRYAFLDTLDNDSVNSSLSERFLPGITIGFFISAGDEIAKSSFYVKAPVISIAVVHTLIKLEVDFTNSSEPYIELNNVMEVENIVVAHDEI